VTDARGGLIEVDGVAVRVTNPDRVMWPRTGTTKADVISYYHAVADALLPNVVGHPLTLHRFPEGVDGPHFFQTRAPAHPPWIRTATMAMPRTGKVFESIVIDNRAGLVWAANVAAIELHPYLGVVGALGHPTALVLDLDPGPPADIFDAAALALLMRAELDDRGLAPQVNTSGGVGLHVRIPLGGDVTYDTTKAAAREIARTFTDRYPDRVTDRMARASRPGKVFVDWSQNDPGKSTVAPYSLRGMPVPTVATPISWTELEHAVDRRRPDDLYFAPAQVLDRLGLRTG
jgi:bifunctional non-homologous end joining protein LigD